MAHPSPHRVSHGPHADHHRDHTHNHTHDQTEILDLEAEVFAEHTASVIDRLPLTAGPRRIVDLGCGTGAGTLALLDRFPDAEVTAVDSSAAHLRRLGEKASAAGAAERVRLVRADLDAARWPRLGTPELVWASASLHHLADPESTLRTVHDMLAPSGLFALVETGGFPRFLPEDAPETAPGLEERCHAVQGRHTERLPHRGADWGPRLARAGFTVEEERHVTVAVGPSRTDAVGRFAVGGLRRIRAGVASALTSEDLIALDGLLDTDGPHSILRRADLGVRTERTVFAARRT